MAEDPRGEISLTPQAGLHCGHYFYRFDRSRLRNLAPAEISDGCACFAAVLEASDPQAPSRLQTWLVGGHKADFATILLDEDPLKIDGVHQRLMSGPLGTAIQAVWSFVSMTEVSEYLPDVEKYGESLAAEGLDRGSDAFRVKLEQYRRRYEIMVRQRLQPDLPVWPAVCFYPMNKRRSGGDNWFRLPFEERERMMAEHGASGMEFAGKVTQLVTVAVGLDDWEWGVTLWARNPQYLKDIVYRLRFDEASARFGEFGPFYVGYLAPPRDILRHCRVA